MVIVHKSDTPPRGNSIPRLRRTDIDPCPLCSNSSISGPGAHFVVRVSSPLHQPSEIDVVISHNTTMQPNYQVRSTTVLRGWFPDASLVGYAPLWGESR